MKSDTVIYNCKFFAWEGLTPLTCKNYEVVSV